MKETSLPLGIAVSAFGLLQMGVAIFEWPWYFAFFPDNPGY
jgi:hypothetical protein